MSGRALSLTYHATQHGPAPLCIDPAVLRAHLDLLVECRAATMTVTELGAALRQGELPERAVALTFDDGFASVAREAAPMLAERGLKATVFCVAGHLGGWNDWPTQQPGAPRMELATAEELSALASGDIEIGCHGLHHTPLDCCPQPLLERELCEAKSVLESAVGARVSSFAYPYGARPGPEARALVEREYAAACTTTLAVTEPGTDVFALPRIDAHYLRRPALLRRALLGSLGPYLPLRRAGARARRVVVKDYAGVSQT